MRKFNLIAFFLCCGWFAWCLAQTRADDPVMEPMPTIPAGVDVQTRGPVHEAFASPTTDPQPSPLVQRKPPAQLDELPPEEKPDGNVVWIGGYWAWDVDRQDYMWVSGCWRAKPSGREWVPGYWREQDTGWTWVAGFWGKTETNGNLSEVSYLAAAPPAAPQVAPPGDPPAADTFYIPGGWTWVDADARYEWRAGYWTRSYPGYVYIPGDYRWTPRGYIYVPGYWDQTLDRRGLLYAPVVVDFNVVGPRFVYCPAYAVTDVYVMDSLFIWPGHCHYYYGDYYGPRYVALGFEHSVLWSRHHYDPIIVYERWHNPRWYDSHVRLVGERNAGRAPLPPRRFVNNPHLLASARTVAVARGEHLVALDRSARLQARDNAHALHVAANENRNAMERPSRPGPAGLEPRPGGTRAPTLIGNQKGGNLNMPTLRPTGPAVQASRRNTPPPQPTPHKASKTDEKKKS